MHKRRLVSAIIIMFFFICPLPYAGAAPDASSDAENFFDEWNFSGSNTLRPEWYATNGDHSNSIYRYRSFQTYDELDFNFSRNWSAYSTTRGRMFGVINFSDYRRPENGFTLERFNITHEKGDVAVPFRVEAGDYFSFFTRRTTQRSLKGVQADFQPGFSLFGESHSLILNAGTSQADYRDTETLDDDMYYGFSWLAGTEKTHVSFNLVNNSRKEDTTGNIPSIHQNVYSVAADHAFLLMSQDLILASEVSLFDGDIAGENSDGKNKGLSDTGIFARLDGKNKTPLTYSLLYESYGEDFRPTAASVSPDRRSTELRAGWAFQSGLRLNGRYQLFRDNVESGNYTDTRTMGITLNGPFHMINGSNIGLNTFLSDVDSQDNTVDTRSFNSNLNFSMPLPGDWSGRSSLLFTRTEDRKNNSIPAETKEAKIGANHIIEFLGFRGGVDLGLLWRDTQKQSRDYGTNLGLNLSNGPHRINATYNLLTQDMDTGNNGNLWTQALAANYEFTSGQHTFRFEGNIDGRNSDQPGTRDYKVACSYRYSFDKKAGASRRKHRQIEPLPERVSAAGKISPMVSAEIPSGPLNLTDFKPGMPTNKAMRLASARNMGSGISISDMIVYEYRYFDDIDQRQRFVLSGDGTRLEVAAVVISLDAAGNLDDASEIYNKVQSALSAGYGNPETYNEGNFSPNLAGDLNAGKFIRNSEWRTKTGIVRLGIPQRLDGQVRIEVQFAASFPPPRDTFWSLEGLF